MSDVVEVNDSNFEVEVLGSELPVLVDYSAVWCKPCQAQLPIIEKFASQFIGQVKVCTVDIDEAPRVAAKFGVRGVPTLMLFRNGQKVDQKVGLTTAAALHSFVMEKMG